MLIQILIIFGSDLIAYPMEVLKKLIEFSPNVEQSLYLQITNSFIQNIRLGRLRKGMKLPGSREMAAMLEINRMTVVAAYEELQTQGWIEMRPRSGTFIKCELPEFQPKKILEDRAIEAYPEQSLFEVKAIRYDKPYRTKDFPNYNYVIIDDGFPDVRLSPVEELVRSFRRVTRQSVYRKYFMYGNPEGADLLRENLSVFLKETRGLPISASNVMITKGAQMGIYLAASLLIDRDDHVIVGDPGFSCAERTLKQKGAIINRVTVDDEGLDVDQIEALCQKKKIKLIYVIPHHHHPTTVTMTQERRIRLLELAARYQFAILEDDYDYDFHYARNPILPMATLDFHGSIIYLGTMAKTLAPSVRIGFLVGPENFIREAANLRRIVDAQGDSLLEVAIADLFADGTITRHIKKTVKIYKERRDHFCEILKTEFNGHVDFNIPEGGMSIWTKFTDRDVPAIIENARKKGLIVPNGSDYNSATTNYNASRLGFASMDLAEQTRALEILKDCL